MDLNQPKYFSFFWSMRSELKEDMSTLSQALLLEAYLLAAPEHLKVETMISMLLVSSFVF